MTRDRDATLLENDPLEPRTTAPAETGEDLQHVVDATLASRWFVTYEDVLEAWRVHQGSTITDAEAATVQNAYREGVMRRPLADGAAAALVASSEWQTPRETAAFKRWRKSQVAPAGRPGGGGAGLGWLAGALLVAVLVLGVIAALVFGALLLLALVVLSAMASLGPRWQAQKRR
jgi:Flp pilus assembly protein TadB